MFFPIHPLDEPRRLFSIVLNACEKLDVRTQASQNRFAIRFLHFPAAGTSGICIALNERFDYCDFASAIPILTPIHLAFRHGHCSSANRCGRVGLTILATLIAQFRINLNGGWYTNRTSRTGCRQRRTACASGEVSGQQILRPRSNTLR